MTSPDEPEAESAAEFHNHGIRTLLETFLGGDPQQTLKLRDILANLQQSAFGVFLFVAILPAFIPIPGIAGGLSGPLVTLIGLQMLFRLRRPWLPRMIGERGPRRSTMQRFIGRISPLLQRLDRVLHPRCAALLEPKLAHAFTALLLVLLGILLSLPIPFTNYLFGVLLLLFALALLERDGYLMAICWLLGSICVGISAMTSSQLIELLRELIASWAN
jgi:hypothetical protein